MSNFALGRFVRVLLLFLLGFAVTFAALVHFQVRLGEKPAYILAFLVGTVFAEVARRHT